MTKFALNANDPYIRLIQRALNEQLKINLTRDGNLGPATQNAIRQYQIKLNMPPGTGSYEGPSADAMDVYIASRFLNAADYVQAANKLGCEPAAVKAVTMVESSGEGFLPSGQTTILFERHIFRKQLDAKLQGNPPLVQRLLAQLNVPATPGLSPLANLQMFLAGNYNDLYNAQPGGYGNEYGRLSRAMGLDAPSGQESCSWGLFQIMGYYWSRLGFGSAAAMVNTMNASEHAQIAAFTQFILTDNNLLTAIRTKNWTNFAKFYNGSNYAINKYDTKLAAAYAAASK